MKKITSAINYFVFFFLRNPLYKYIYNKRGNHYECRGKLYNSTIKLTGTNNTIIIEDEVFLRDVLIEISGQNNRLIVRMGSKFYSKGKISIFGKNNLVDIGENTYNIGPISILVQEDNNKIVTGEHCMFAQNTFIRNSDSHSILSLDGKRINPSKDVILGKHVWVGYGATILKGTVLGDNCIVGTQAVISGNHPQPGCIYAGNPAKLVKENIDWKYEFI